MTPTNPGEVSIKINGQQYTLKASLQAYRMVNMIGPGFTPVLQSIRNFDAAVITQIICCGTGKMANGDAEKVETEVFAHGLMDLADPVTEFVTMLANGGRKASDDQPEASGSGGNPQNA